MQETGKKQKINTSPLSAFVMQIFKNILDQDEDDENELNQISKCQNLKN
jgi:hypothetical protein